MPENRHLPVPRLEHYLSERILDPAWLAEIRAAQQEFLELLARVEAGLEPPPGDDNEWLRERNDALRQEMGRYPLPKGWHWMGDHVE